MTETIQPKSSTGALSGQGIIRAAILVLIGTILSRVIGLLRESLLAHAFGGGFEYEAYLAALRPTETIFFVVAGGALGSAFIPTFASYLVKDQREKAWRLGSAVANLITLVLIVLAGLTALFARPIVVPLLVPGFDPAFQDLTAHLMQIMLISPVIFGVSGLLMGVLNAHQRFLLPALAGVMYNVGIVFGVVVLARPFGIVGVAWGAVIGALLHFLIQIPALLSIQPKYTPTLDIYSPDVRHIARLMAPRVLGLSIVQINFWVNTNLASGMIVGSYAALTRAWTVMLMPQAVIAQSVANAVFPTFAVHAAQGDTRALRSTMIQVTRAVLFLSIPASVALIVLRLPIVNVIFGYGEFTPTDAEATAWALLFFAMGLVSHSLVEILTRAFYALHDTRTPVIIGGGAMILNIVLSLILIQFIGDPNVLETGTFAGLALANTLATTLEGLILIVLIRAKVGGLDVRPLLIGISRASIASAAMGAALALSYPLIDLLGRYFGLLAVVVIGAIVFWGVAYAIGSEDARLFISMVWKRIRR